MMFLYELWGEYRRTRIERLIEDLILILVMNMYLMIVQ